MDYFISISDNPEAIGELPTGEQLKSWSWYSKAPFILQKDALAAAKNLAKYFLGVRVFAFRNNAALGTIIFDHRPKVFAGKEA